MKPFLIFLETSEMHFDLVARKKKRNNLVIYNDNFSHFLSQPYFSILKNYFEIKFQQNIIFWIT